MTGRVATVGGVPVPVDEVDAREARLRALELCSNPAERSLLERKLRG